MKPGTMQIEGEHLRIDMEPKKGARGSTKAQLDEWMSKAKGGFHTEQLRDAFRQVSDKDHWKNDIDAIVPADMKEVLTYAIPFHTGGGEVEFHDAGNGMLRVTAPGYWSNGMEG